MFVVLGTTERLQTTIFVTLRTWPKNKTHAISRNIHTAIIATSVLRRVAIVGRLVDKNSGFCQRFCIFAVAQIGIMPTIRKSLSSKVDGDGKSEILLRFSGGREAVYRVKSGIRIPPSRWNSDEARITLPRLETQEKRDLIRAAAELDAVCNLLISSFADADKTSVNSAWFEDILDRYRHPEKNTPYRLDFFGLFDKFLNDNESSRPRENHFKVLQRQLRRFELYSGRTWNLDTFTADDLGAFKDFLVNEHAIAADKRFEYIYKAVPESRTPGPRGYNAIGNSLRLFRTFNNWCIKHRLTTNYPFREYSIESPVYGTPYYITIEERQRIADADLSARPQIAIQRDVFVFHCCIGCRVGDLLRLTRANIIDGAVEYIARKTSGERPVTVRVPLNETASGILERYRDFPGPGLLPFISSQKYNDAIKTVFRLAGIDRVVTVLNPRTRREEQRPLYEIASSHIARRTFVGNLYKQVKDPNLISSLSGHVEGSTAFYRYRNVDEQMKRDLVRLLDDHVKPTE